MEIDHRRIWGFGYILYVPIYYILNVHSPFIQSEGDIFSYMKFKMAERNFAENLFAQNHDVNVNTTWKWSEMKNVAVVTFTVVWWLLLSVNKYKIKGVSESKDLQFSFFCLHQFKKRGMDQNVHPISIFNLQIRSYR